MEIEVEWEVNIKSGLTNINISDLDCKNKKEWDKLDREEQRIRIDKYLMESDQPMLKPMSKEW